MLRAERAMGLLWLAAAAARLHAAPPAAAGSTHLHARASRPRCATAEISARNLHTDASVTPGGPGRRLQNGGGLAAQWFDSTSPAALWSLTQRPGLPLPL